MSAKKRTQLSLETKYEMIQKKLNGIKSVSIQLEYHVSSSTLSTIFKNKDKIIEEYNKNYLLIIA